MFNPTQHDVRQFFCETYRKSLAREILTPIETIASHWIFQHPEYKTDFANLEAALKADYSVDHGKTNPFLHLSLHLSISEQISIDQPSGIKAAYLRLAQRLQSEHEAHHVIMESLSAMIWESQRNGTPFNDVAYIEAIQQKLRK